MPPRHLYGNTWYVGTCGISALLIATPSGHVLIDGTNQAGGRVIERNLRALGVRLQDIHTILLSHEHLDHAGGIAGLQRATGAAVLARGPAAEALRKGMSDRRDPQFTSSKPFPPVARVRTIADGQMLDIGGVHIRNLPMPGHTAGGSGWTWRSCETGVCRNIVYADSVTALSDKSYRYGAPGALAGPLQRTLERLTAQRCDILITTHPSASELFDRMDGKAPLVDATACRKLAAEGREGLKERLAEEAAGRSQ